MWKKIKNHVCWAFRDFYDHRMSPEAAVLAGVVAVQTEDTFEGRTILIVSCIVLFEVAHLAVRLLSFRGFRKEGCKR